MKLNSITVVMVVMSFFKITLTGKNLKSFIVNRTYINIIFQCVNKLNGAGLALLLH